MRRILFAVVLACLWPGAASAAFVHGADGATIQPFAGWAASSYAPAPNADVLVTVDAGGCRVGVLSCAHTNDRQTLTGSVLDTIDMQLALVPVKQQRGVFLHELGHVFDWSMMNDESRVSFQRLSGNWKPWFGGEGVVRPPYEQFAEAYKTCAFYGAAYDPNRLLILQTYHWIPSKRTNARVCRLIERVAAG